MISRHEGVIALADGKLTFDTSLDSGGFSKGLKGLGAAFGALALAAGASAVALGKAVLSAYADYEQLVGGVDTLFKESSQELQAYAANAYKTAGLSANDYMETVTSFSASLIQSLGGDTEKAVQYADMAITDMSDNANKMGTDIEAIQDAYQGFAKQNFTMLDNLKLGYGGTKTEMERLLADAEAISGIHYDISSYADIVSAIHVVQDEMGITGTTAEEAEKTITGSLNSLKASYQNLLVGLGDSNADLEQLFQNMATALQNVISNVTPVIENIVNALPVVVDALLSSLTTLLPTLLNAVTGLFSQLLNTIILLLPQLIPVAVSAVMTITQALLDNLPLLVDTAVQLILALVTGLAQQLPTLIPMAVQAVLTIAETILDNLDQLIDAALELIMALAEGLIDALPVLIEKAPEIVQKLVDAIVDNIDKILDCALELVMAMADAIIDNLPLILESGWEIVNSLIEGIGQFLYKIGSKAGEIVKEIWDKITSTDWLGLGRDILSGIGEGIKNGVGAIWGAVKSAASGILNMFKNAFGINSPSKLFEDEVGPYLPQGTIGGAEDEIPRLRRDIDRQAHELAAYMQASMEAESARMSGTVSANAEYRVITNNPSIQNNITPSPVNVNVEGHLEIDGREFAIVTAPYISEELAFSGG